MTLEIARKEAALKLSREICRRPEERERELRCAVSLTHPHYAGPGDALGLADERGVVAALPDLHAATGVHALRVHLGGHLHLQVVRQRHGALLVGPLHLASVVACEKIRKCSSNIVS